MRKISVYLDIWWNVTISILSTFTLLLLQNQSHFPPDNADELENTNHQHQQWQWQYNGNNTSKIRSNNLTINNQQWDRQLHQHTPATSSGAATMTTVRAEIRMYQVQSPVGEAMAAITTIN